MGTTAQESLIGLDAQVWDDFEILNALVEQFRVYQSADGSIPAPDDRCAALLDQIVERAAPVQCALGLHDQEAAFRADCTAWKERGLSAKPEFDRTRDAFQPPRDGKFGFFVGPVLTTNGTPPVGRRMETFLIRRREPRLLSEISARYPHPKNICQSVELLGGTKGFLEGNCLVFFPENIPARTKVVRQAYAVFFFNKFKRIHEHDALPAARQIFTADSLLTASHNLTEEDCYEARSIWGYLHDYYHHQGRWPIDENVKLKTNWYVGLLEEIKVDAQTIITLNDDEGLPYGDIITAMILLERLIRYPREIEAERNFDSGTGVYLYSWLRSFGAISVAATGELVLDRGRVVDGLRVLVSEIEGLEIEAADEEQYRRLALEHCRKHLVEGSERNRFSLTDDQQILVAN